MVKLGYIQQGYFSLSYLTEHVKVKHMFKRTPTQICTLNMTFDNTWEIHKTISNWLEF